MSVFCKDWSQLHYLVDMNLFKVHYIILNFGTKTELWSVVYGQYKIVWQYLNKMQWSAKPYISIICQISSSCVLKYCQDYFVLSSKHTQTFIWKSSWFLSWCFQISLQFDVLKHPKKVQHIHQFQQWKKGHHKNTFI